MVKTRRSRRGMILALSAVGAVVAVGAILVFRPWLLWVNTEVHDEVPGAASAPPATSGTARASGSASGQASPSSSPAPQGPVVVATGRFTSHEHETSGEARIYRLPDGNHQLALVGLKTSTGPDVHVWLSAGPVVEGRKGWFTAKDHPHLDLGEIKGNQGNQVYALPPGTDPAKWPTVDLWCQQFSVSFGAAALS